MCGRFTNHLSWTEIVELYNLTSNSAALNLPARYNVAPTQDVPFVIETGDGRALKTGRWWLVPHWAKEIPKYTLFNARSEDAHKKPSFRDAFKHKRCVIPASGYYEWTKGEDGGKDPHYIYLPTKAPLSFAGLWAENELLGITSCTILTAPAASEIKHLHHRMPIILGAGSDEGWLDPQTPIEVARALLQDNKGSELTSHRISREVNNSRSEGSHLIEPVT